MFHVNSYLLQPPHLDLQQVVVPLGQQEWRRVVSQLLAVWGWYLHNRHTHLLSPWKRQVSTLVVFYHKEESKKKIIHKFSTINSIIHCHKSLLLQYSRALGDQT